MYLNLIRAFEEYIKGIERNDFQNKKFEKRRIERKNREAFAALVQDKLSKREITSETKWRDFVKNHLFENPVYLSLIG